MLKNNKIIFSLFFLILICTVNTSIASDNGNQQYMQIYYQRQLEKAAKEKAQYEANHYANGNRRGLADIVGGNGSNTRDIEFNYGHEMTDEEYEQFQRENRW